MSPTVGILIRPPKGHQLMPTLQIQHAVTDFGVWSSAFAHFADVREKGGVIHQRISRPVDDPNYVIISLDFSSHEQARSFLSFLENKVWSSPDRSPALRGLPQTAILDIEDER
jgi:hypothetical protein